MREQFGKPSIFDNPMYPVGQDNPGRSLVLIGQQYRNYWQYFTWQFGRDWPVTLAAMAAAVEHYSPSLFLVIGGIGALASLEGGPPLRARHGRADVHAHRSRWSSISISNGATRNPIRASTTRCVSATTSLSPRSSRGACGWGWDSPRSRPRLARASPTAYGWQLAAPVFLIALIPFIGNRLSAPRRGETVARDYARDVLASVDPYALIITTGDNDTFPLWHAQEVEGLRRDVSVMVLSLANTNWYLAQLQRRPPAPFPGAPAPATKWMSRYYLNGPADTLPPYILLEQAATGAIGPIQVTVDPRVLGRPYLGRSDLAVLQIIKDQLGRRPIYFSSSTANIPDQMGLSPYLVNEGLVRRLMPAPVVANDSVRLLEGRGYVNVPRLQRFAFEVYRGGQASARARPRGWVDTPSQNSLFGYVLVYDTIAAALREREPALATRAIALRDSILANTTYGLPKSED